MSNRYEDLVRTGVIDTPPCNRPMQNHLRKRFLDAQGPSMKDSAARERRAENARRYEAWSSGAGQSLSPTGSRAL